MVETKARNELADPEVHAKSDAAAKWCQNARDYAQTTGGKSWQYLMIPHDEINESRKLVDYERFVKK